MYAILSVSYRSGSWAAYAILLSSLNDTGVFLLAKNDLGVVLNSMKNGSKAN